MIQPHPLAALMEMTAADLRKHGDDTWQRAEDWTRARKIAGDSTRGGGVGTGRTDRNIDEQREDDAAASRKAELTALTSRLDADIRRLRWLIEDACPDKPRVERVNTVAACLVCAGPAVQPRRGMCDACRKAWERADKPDLTAFKRQRLRSLEEAQRVVHEHEVA